MRVSSGCFIRFFFHRYREVFSCSSSSYGSPVNGFKFTLQLGYRFHPLLVLWNRSLVLTSFHHHTKHLTNMTSCCFTNPCVSDIIKQRKRLFCSRISLGNSSLPRTGQGASPSALLLSKSFSFSFSLLLSFHYSGVLYSPLSAIQLQLHCEISFFFSLKLAALYSWQSSSGTRAAEGRAIVDTAAPETRWGRNLQRLVPSCSPSCNSRRCHLQN